MLTIDNLNIKVKNKLIVKNLGFSTAKGSCICFHGTCSSAKSLLMNALAGADKRNLRNILYNGVSIFESPQEYSAITLYMPKQNILDYRLSVLNNLKFWGAIHNMESEIEAVIFYLKLEKHLKERINMLPDHLKRRVNFSKLLLSPAVLWILDEPFLDLDEESKNILYSLIKSRCYQVGTVLFTSLNSYKIENLNIDNIPLKDFSNEPTSI